MSRIIKVHLTGLWIKWNEDELEKCDTYLRDTGTEAGLTRALSVIAPGNYIYTWIIQYFSDEGIKILENLLLSWNKTAYNEYFSIFVLEVCKKYNVTIKNIIYRLSHKKLYGSVGSVHSMLKSLSPTHCALLTVLDCSLKAIPDHSVINTTNTKQTIRR